MTKDGPGERPAVEAWLALLRLVRRLDSELDAELAVTPGMTHDRYDVLYQLSLAPGGRLRMSDLASVLLLPRSSCTRVVGELSDLGWVSRKHDTHDRRSVWAVLTRAGRSVQRRAAVGHVAAIERRLSGLDVEALRRVLSDLE
jgi:DNA-binding MarR family transcriptional regulator